jgi:hypothetical protein
VARDDSPYHGRWVEGVNCDFDYDQVKSVIETGYKSRNVVLDGGVVENCSVQQPGGGSADIARKIDRWGEKAIVPEAGEDLQLGTDPDNGRGPKLREEMQKHLDTSGAGGRLVAESQHDHKGKGLLASWPGSDILWVSCTGFSALGAGSVAVKGISPEKQGLIKASIEKFSDKPVKFE